LYFLFSLDSYLNVPLAFCICGVVGLINLALIAFVVPESRDSGVSLNADSEIPWPFLRTAIQFGKAMASPITIFSWGERGSQYWNMFLLGLGWFFYTFSTVSMPSNSSCPTLLFYGRVSTVAAIYMVSIGIAGVLLRYFEPNRFLNGSHLAADWNVYFHCRVARSCNHTDFGFAWLASCFAACPLQLTADAGSYHLLLANRTTEYC
jgi:hypothetical protein